MIALRKMIASFHSELHRARKATRRGVIKVGFITVLLLAGKSLTEAHITLPFLRGGYIALTSFKTPSHEHTQRMRKNPPKPVLFHLANLQHALNVLGSKIQSETNKQWSDFHSHIGREWSKFAGNILKIFPSSKQSSLGSRKLDEVLASFKSVLRNGKEVEVGQLLKACRAHLTLVKSGGTALKLVAKDMENNLLKAEALYHHIRSTNRGRDLTSLLEVEREQGIHNGNVLQDQSAAMGLLWIRRSLAFQMDLYSSLMPSSTKSPADAAMEAYSTHLLPFHGWMLQKVFPLSLSQMPEREVFIAKFGGRDVKDVTKEHEQEIVDKLRDLVTTWEPLIGAWKRDFETMDMEDMRKV
ncbi:hypothetical protein HJC23_013153 [Cyclotella cryptica]|uniref:Glycolipid transfer protein domain-containing protein n=1 Tax=Cyclotella cryptica TaxID=29204 RepID=A0ABD3QMN9_9STRA